MFAVRPRCKGSPRDDASDEKPEKPAHFPGMIAHGESPMGRRGTDGRSRPLSRSLSEETFLELWLRHLKISLLLRSNGYKAFPQ